MRQLLILLAVLAGATPAAYAEPGPAPSAAKPPSAASFTPPAETCRKWRDYRAGMGSVLRGDPPQPRNLGELPPAEGYMAVYRLVDGCEEPMTAVEYRQSQRR